MFIFRLIGPLLLLVLLYWVVQRYSKKHGLTTSQFKWVLGIAVLLGIGIVLVMLGRIPVQTLAAPFLLAFTFAMRNIGLLVRLFPFLQSWHRKRAQSGGSPNISTIKTQFLHMELQHATGEMDGEVLQGQFQGHRLSTLTLNELFQLVEECRRDADSMQVLEAYLDRAHPEWREDQAGEGNEAGRKHREYATAEAEMDEQLALEILGLRPGASDEEIVGAHRKLMQKMHPDRGGSDYLARKINEARDFLLK